MNAIYNVLMSDGTTLLNSQFTKKVSFFTLHVLNMGPILAADSNGDYINSPVA